MTLSLNLGELNTREDLARTFMEGSWRDLSALSDQLSKAIKAEKDRMYALLDEHFAGFTKVG